ncbi:MAG TPA: Plug domain-containing protein, partial [Candidatus Marinimicrobia bacterium]|nr:Plug domain-containing protein [Candidatus Neomarinimicrobiota bacterium]
MSNSVLTLSIYESAAKGARDISDLLISDQRLSITESQNGKKEVFVRGMGEDEMVVLLNGVQINSNYEQRYDFSLIDVSNFTQIDLLIGNNLAVPSAIGSAAALNLIPKYSEKSGLELMGILGTHDTESWLIGGALNAARLNSYFSLNQRRSSQRYLGENPDSASIQRQTDGMAGNIRFQFPSAKKIPLPDYGEYNFLYTNRSYQNRYYFEKLDLLSVIHNLIMSKPIRENGTLKMVYSDQSLNEFSEWDIRGLRQQKEQKGKSEIFSLDLNYSQSGTDLFLNFQHSEDGIELLASADSAHYSRKRAFFTSGLAFTNSHYDEQVYSSLQFNLAWD